MGGYGSGRSGGPTTESGFTLNLSKLLRDGLVRPGSFLAGSIVWTNTATGERVGSIGYEANLGQESGSARLKYTTTRWDGERRESDYWIQLETTPRWPEMVVHLSSDRRTGGETLPARRRIHFRITPGLPARIPLPT
jgi:hypothetical protein